jgi:hypothetical protein
MPVLNRLLATLAALCISTAALAGPTIVTYPRPESLDDDIGEYGIALLQLALDRSGSRYLVQLSAARMQQNRAIIELQSGSGRIDVVGTVTSREREDAMLPIRIPMTRGLIGWRLALVDADRRDLLREIRSLADLQALPTGQGQDWPDLRILRHSGFKVEPVMVYHNLFGMLHAGRIVWAPRSVNEIWAEAAAHPELVVDPYVALRYPSADYFFVRNGNTALAEDIRRGMEAALADGSFEKLFYQHYGPLIRKARLEQRRLISIPNPLLPPETPLARKELWFSLEDIKRMP